MLQRLQSNRRLRRDYPHRDNIAILSDSEEDEFDLSELRQYDLPEIVEALLHQVNDLVETEHFSSSDAVSEHHSLPTYI